MSTAPVTVAQSSFGRRLSIALLFGAFAAVGFACVARPALLFSKSLGLFAPVLPWDVPLGRLFLLLALGLALETVRLGVALTTGTRLRPRDRLLLLSLLVGSIGARAAAGEPRPAASPVPRLVSALRLTAEALDRGYATAGSYQPDVPALDQSLAGLGGVHFVYRGREVVLRAVPLEAAPYAQIAPRSGDLPGALYIALSADHRRAFLTILTLDERGRPDILRGANGRPLLVEARFGTHSAPGRDPQMPEYPGMQTPSQGKAPLQ